MADRNTPIRRRVQADVLQDALKKLLPDDCPDKAELLQLLAKLPSEGERGGDEVGAQMARMKVKEIRKVT